MTSTTPQPPEPTPRTPSGIASEMPAGQGRAAFERLGPTISLTRRALRLLPKGLFTSTWWAVEWLPGLAGTAARYLWASRLFASIGDNVRIGPGCSIEFWEHINCGSNVSIHRGCYLSARGGISIGDDVSIAHRSSLVAFEHSFDRQDLPIKYNALIGRPITIESDVWVGCGVRILADAHIESRAVIAAGAVVPAGIYTTGIHAGVPAKLKRPFT